MTAGEYDEYNSSRR